MKKVYHVTILLYLTLVITSAYSQVKTNISLLTEQEKTYVNTSKSLYTEYKNLHKQYLKDSTKLSKKAIKRGRAEAKKRSDQDQARIEAQVKQEVRQMSDSLYNIYDLGSYESMAERYKEFEENGDWKEFAKGKIEEQNEYSVLDKYLKEGELDAEALYMDMGKEEAEKYLAEYEEYEAVNAVKSEAEKYTGELDQLKETIQNPDNLFTEENMEQFAEDQLMELDEMQELEKQSSELTSIQEIPEQFQAVFKQYQDRVANAGNPEYLKHQARQHAKAFSSDFLKEKIPAITETQQKLGKLKKKYSTVPTSKDLSTAKKTNSLEGVPLGNRLIFGGTFQLSRNTNKINLDISPILGYKFNTQWSAGVSGVYRATFGQQDEILDYLMDENVYGYRIFTEFVFWKGFFGHGEYESMNNEIEIPNSDLTARVWSEGILIGIGKNYSYNKKLKGNIMVLYNTMHEEGVSPYKSPWQVRFGLLR